MKRLIPLLVLSLSAMVGNAQDYQKITAKQFSLSCPGCTNQQVLKPIAAQMYGTRSIGTNIIMQEFTLTFRCPVCAEEFTTNWERSRPVVHATEVIVDKPKDK